MSSTTPVPPLIAGDAYFSEIQVAQQLVDKTSVTQITSLATPVTINSASGTIVTISSGVVTAGASATISVVNSFCSVGSVVLATVNGYSGAGIPVVASCVPTATGFNLVIVNVGGVNTNASITVAFMIL